MLSVPDVQPLLALISDRVRLLNAPMAQGDGDSGRIEPDRSADRALADIEDAALRLQEMCADLRKNWR